MLVALQDEEKGRTADRSGDRAVFIAEAKGWANAEGVTAEAFQSFGVPDEDLREAGFIVTATSSRSRARSASAGAGSRAARLPLEDVEAAAAKLGKQWKLSDLAAAIERDVATARNYVNKLASEGHVTVVGDDPGHDGRGRAPKVYSNA